MTWNFNAVLAKKWLNQAMEDIEPTNTRNEGHVATNRTTELESANYQNNISCVVWWVVWTGIWWVVWTERNDCLFCAKPPNTTRALERGRLLLTSWTTKLWLWLFGADVPLSFFSGQFCRFFSCLLFFIFLLTLFLFIFPEASAVSIM